MLLFILYNLIEKLYHYLSERYILIIDDKVLPGGADDTQDVNKPGGGN